MSTDADLFTIGQLAARTGLPARTIRFWSDSGLVSPAAQERQQMIDDFVDGVFADADPAQPGAGIARRMRELPAELPDDPAPEQVDAWIELAELIADPDFRQRVKTTATAGPQADQQSLDYQAVPSNG
jgi:MerR family regulatory protein